MLGKRCQSAGGAAILIAAIAGLIILYLLFLPPEDRDEIFGKNISAPRTVKGVGEDARLLLKEFPGSITITRQDQFEHKINSFNLFESNEERVLKSFDSIYIESKRGETKKRTFAFSANKGKVSNVQLSFNVKSHSGRLIIRINDIEVLNSEVQTQSVISLDNLQDENVVELVAEEVGFQFWKTNFYELSDVKITAVVKALESLEAKQTFIVGSEEAGNIESAAISYFVECKQGQTGILKVFVNDIPISSTSPDCGSPVKTEFDPSIIVRGANNIRFSSDKGAYLIDQIAIKTKLVEPVEPVYFFEVNSTKYSWVANDTFNAMLRMSFVDDGLEKRAELNINNRKTFMDAKRATNFSKDISAFIIEGNNFIRIAPEKTLNIIELTIKLE